MSRINKTSLFLFLLVSLSTQLTSANNDTSTSQGRYLGQTPPGLIPKVFAPDIVSTKGWEYGVVFSPTLDEMYFIREVNTDTNPQQQFVMYKQEDNWKEQVISPRVGTPTLSPDNNFMFFGRTYKQRTKTGWSEVKRLGPEFDDIRIMRATSSLNGTLAFDEATQDGNGLMRYSTLEKGKRLTPKPFPKQINTGKWSAHPFIAPDETYVIWDAQGAGDSRNADLFISFKQVDGTWGDAITFNDTINTNASEFAAQVSPDGKYLFFNRNISKDNVDTFWVDANVIEQLKPKKIKQIEALQGPKVYPTQALGKLGDIPLLENPFINTKPVSFDKTLPATELILADNKAQSIVNLAKDIGDGKYGHYDSLLIAHKNKLVFESYFERGRYGLAHGQASATKGYTSLVLGRAIQLGYLTMADLNKPLIQFFDEIDASKLTQGTDKITLYKALTMHGGLTLSDEKWTQLQVTPEKIQGPKLVQALLENSNEITEDTQVYRYGNFNPILVMAVIDSVTPNGAKAFIKSEVLDKLNISNYHWDDHPSGLPEAGWKVKFTSRDMLKLGLVVINQGKWQGKPFISSNYLKVATSGLVKPTEDWIPNEYKYGFFWYHTPIKIKEQTYDVSFAWGGGGQRVIVVKELELVIAITGFDREDAIMNVISNIVIPAFVK